MKKFAVLLCVASAMLGCGNPGGISDEFYEKYQKLGAPKILYKCDDRVGYTAGVGIAATYNKILQSAERECGDKKFSILKSQQR